LAWITVAADASITDKNKIYIGCMTGTSVDRYADFTAAMFSPDGQLICYQNTAVEIPSALRKQLLSLMETSAKGTNHLRQQTEMAFTQFLIQAYQTVLSRFDLLNEPKDRIVLSPHGQTLHHAPNANPPHTDQLMDAEHLAKALGYAVVHKHRQAPLAVSQAAPLAPVLIRRLFHSKEINTVVLNGGGIANICTLLSDQVLGWDTGPANGILDALVQTSL